MSLQIGGIFLPKETRSYIDRIDTTETVAAVKPTVNIESTTTVEPLKTSLEQSDLSSLTQAPIDNCFYGCVSIQNGRENNVSELLKSIFPFDVIAPVFARYHRKDGLRSLRQFKLFPGYLFFRVDPSALEQMDKEIINNIITIINSISGVHRLLTYDKNNWILLGNNRQIAEMLFDNNGIVGLSRSRFVDGKLRVLDGFLAPFEDKIKKVDKKHNTAMIEIEYYGSMRTIWLGYELVA